MMIPHCCQKKIRCYIGIIDEQTQVSLVELCNPSMTPIRSDVVIKRCGFARIAIFFLRKRLKRFTLSKFVELGSVLRRCWEFSGVI